MNPVHNPRLKDSILYYPAIYAWVFQQSISNCPTTATSFLICIPLRPVYSYAVQQD